MQYHYLKIFILTNCIFVSVGLSGCAGGRVSNGGQLESYRVPAQEAEWIINGDPIEYDGKLWHPQDGTANLYDSEVYLIGEYRGVQFFVERIDVKPYNRLYTKFSRNQYRTFELKSENE